MMRSALVQVFSASFYGIDVTPGHLRMGDWKGSSKGRCGHGGHDQIAEETHDGFSAIGDENVASANILWESCVGSQE